MRINFIIGLILVCSTLSSCTQKYDLDKIKDIEYHADWAIPLAHGNFSIEDIIKTDSTSFYDFDTDGGIWLTYHNNVESYSLEDLVPNTDKNVFLNRYLTSQESIDLVSNKKVSINYTESITLNNDNVNGETMVLDSAIVGQGTFYFSVRNISYHNLNLKLTIPGMTKNGVAIIKTFNINPRETEDFSVSAVGYHMKLDNSGLNNFDVEFEAEFVDVGSGNPSAGVVVNFQMRDDFKFESVYGDLGRQRTLEGQGVRINLNLFDLDELGSTIFMNEAELRVKWKNSFGVPMDVYFNSISGRNKKNETYLLDVDNLPYPKRVFSSPIKIGDKMEGVAVFKNLDTQTGLGKLSLKDFLDKNVNTLDVDVYAISNPPSTPLPSFKNYLYQFGNFNMDVEVAIQLTGNVTDFSVQDTLDFDLDLEGETDVFESVILKFNSVNGFPINLDANFVFLDSNKNPLFSINNQPGLLLKSAIVDEDGNAITPTENTADFVLDANAILDLPYVRFIFVDASFKTSNGGIGVVRFNKEDRLSLKFGARVVVKEKLSI